MLTNAAAGVFSALFELPMSDPTVPANFYAIKNPVEGTTAEKLAGLHSLTEANILVLEAFFEQVCGSIGPSPRISKSRKSKGFARVEESVLVRRPGTIHVKHNSKTYESISQKAARPSILAVWPYFGIEHVRDTLRFKAVGTRMLIHIYIYSSSSYVYVHTRPSLYIHADSLFACPMSINAKVVFDVNDAFTFLTRVAQHPAWRVVKVDLDKFLKPKEWGWRFIGADLQMHNGQLVECYVVFAQLEEAKKQANRPELTELSNHGLFEKWRGRVIQQLSEDESAHYQQDLTTSRAIYDDAFVRVLNDTTPNQFMDVFKGHAWYREQAKIAYADLVRAQTFRPTICSEQESSTKFQMFRSAVSGNSVV